jgi:hypothetical protein
MKYKAQPFFYPERSFFLSAPCTENPTGCIDGDSISGKSHDSVKTEYFTVPDVSLEGDPRLEFVYFILYTKTPIPLHGAAPGMTRNASGGTNKLSHLVKSHFWS